MAPLKETYEKIGGQLQKVIDGTKEILLKVKVEYIHIVFQFW